MQGYGVGFVAPLLCSTGKDSGSYSDLALLLKPDRSFICPASGLDVGVFKAKRSGICLAPLSWVKAPQEPILVLLG